MQVSKRHIPVVEILGLVVIAAAGGGIYYYQFLVPHTVAVHASPVHRLIFLTAVIVENSTNQHGFVISKLAYLNQSSLPNFNTTTGIFKTAYNSTSYAGSSDNSTIYANAGDNITLYIHAVSVGPPQDPSDSVGHGFSVSPTPSNIIGQIPGTINFGEWYTVTFTVSTPGTYVYRCTIFCSPLHGNMAGNIIVT